MSKRGKPRSKHVASRDRIVRFEKRMQRRFLDEIENKITWPEVQGKIVSLHIFSIGVGEMDATGLGYCRQDGCYQEGF